jgi:hypothetical protein
MSVHHSFLPSMTVTGMESRSKSSNSREFMPTLGFSKSDLPIFHARLIAVHSASVSSSRMIGTSIESFGP